MANSRSGAENDQDKSGTPFMLKSKEGVDESVMSKGLRSHLEQASTSQRQDNLNIKKDNNYK